MHEFQVVTVRAVKVQLSVLENMNITLRPFGLSRVVPPDPTLFAVRFLVLPEQLLPSSASLPTRGRLRVLLTAARRCAAVAHATVPLS